MTDKTWFTADHHFGHRRILTLCQRSFADEVEMREHLIDRWNAYVEPGDVVWHLGDFAYRDRAGEAEAVFHRLNGTKHLVRGNHDGEHVAALPWASVSQMAQIVVDGQRLHLCHYPLLEWQHYHRGGWHLFGHVHGNREGIGASLDVGVDVTDYHPVGLDYVRRTLRQREGIE